MTNELILLNILLAVVFIIGPIITNTFTLGSSKVYKITHALALTVLIFSFFLNLQIAYIIWLLFCVYGLFLYLFLNREALFSFDKITNLIPLTFSVISALWFFCGSNNLYLLGYDANWSYYAALHAGFLGWVLLTCFITISTKTRFKNFYLSACFVFLASFLLIALGIDGVPYIKRLGALIVILLSPALIGFYAFGVTTKNTFSKYLAVLSFLALSISMFLAFENEFLIALLSPLISNSPMVYLHGGLNGLVALPTLALSLLLENKNQ